MRSLLIQVSYVLLVLGLSLPTVAADGKVVSYKSGDDAVSAVQADAGCPPVIGDTNHARTRAFVRARREQSPTPIQTAAFGPLTPATQWHIGAPL